MQHNVFWRRASAGVYNETASIVIDPVQVRFVFFDEDDHNFRSSLRCSNHRTITPAKSLVFLSFALQTHCCNAPAPLIVGRGFSMRAAHLTNYYSDSLWLAVRQVGGYSLGTRYTHQGGVAMKSFAVLLLIASSAYGQVYSDVDLIAMQVQSPVPGTSWDDFSFSQRVELGYRLEACGVRARYWHFDNDFEFAPPVELGLRFNVLDLEATKQVGDFLISGGFRVADWGLSTNGFTIGATQVDPSSADTTQFGVTLAAEGNTQLCGGESWGLAAVYGGRLSLLTGDWNYNRSTNTTLSQIGNFGNDTQDVLEAFAGLEARYGRAFARTALEMQRWDSNALDRRGWYDIGFLGIGTTVGVRF